jgi:hypothetical protein
MMWIRSVRCQIDAQIKRPPASSWQTFLQGWGDSAARRISKSDEKTDLHKIIWF